MVAFEVKYKNGDERSVFIALCEKSTDEVETIMKNNGIEYTEIVSIDSPRFPVVSYLKREGVI